MSSDVFVKCEFCNTAQAIEAQYVGRKVCCAHCGRIFISQALALKKSAASPVQAPAPLSVKAPTPTLNPTVYAVTCPKCACNLGFDFPVAGKKVRCQSCQTQFDAPTSTAVPPMLLGHPGTGTAKQKVAARSKSALTKRPVVRESWSSYTRRNWDQFLRNTFQTTLGQGVLATLCLLLGLICASYLFWLQPKYATEQRWVELWKAADEHFRAGRFAVADSSYQEVTKYAEKLKVTTGPHVQLAEVMQRLAATTAKLDKSLEQAPPPPDLTKPAEAELGSTPAALQAAKQVALLPAVHGDLKKFDAQYETSLIINNAATSVGLEYSGEQRFQDFLAWLSQRYEMRVDNWQSGKAPPTLERVVVWQAVDAFLAREDPVSAKAKAQFDVTLQESQFRRALEIFDQLAHEVEIHPTQQALHAARGQWQRMEAMHSHRAKRERAVWEAFVERLRPTFMKDLQAELVGEKVSPPGAFTTTGPTAYPAESFSRLATTQGNAVAVQGRVCVIAQDRCLALNAANGRVIGSWQVGFDPLWFPRELNIEGDDLLALGWRTESGTVLTILNAENQPVWSWELPADQQFAGPPIAVDDQIFVLLESGELWQFEWSFSGPQARRRLQLPEAVCPGWIPRVDERGLIAVGKEFGIYAVELSSPPRIADVLSLPEKLAAPSLFGLWVPPFLLISEPGDKDESLLHIWYEQNQRLLPSKSFSFAGRLWQTPEVLGSQLLLATEQAETICLLQHQAQDCVQSLLEVQQPDGASNFRPHITTAAGASFLVAGSDQLSCYTVDPLKLTGNRKREMRWEHAWHTPAAVPVQPLQCQGEYVAVAFQLPASQGVVVDYLNLKSGALVWRTRVAAPVTQAWLQNYSTAANDWQVVLQDDRADNFGLRSQAKLIQSAPLLLAPIPSAAAWSPNEKNWRWYDAGQKQIMCETLAGKREPVLDWHSPPASPLGIGAIAEPRLAWVTEGPAVAVWNPRQSTNQPQTVGLEREAPAGEWFRPQWLSADAVYCAHPQGHVLCVQTREQAGRMELNITQRALGDELLSTDLPFAAISNAGTFAIATRRDLVLLEASSLKLRQRLTIPESISTPPVGSDRFFVGLASGQIAAVAVEGKVGPDALQLFPVFSDKVSLLTFNVSRNELYAVSTKGDVAVLATNGQVKKRWSASAPLTLAPIYLPGQLLVTTVAGSLELMTLDNQ